MAFRIKHAGMTASIAAMAAIAGGAWFLTHTGEVRSAKAAQPTAASDVDIAQQTITMTDKQADAFKVLAAEPRAFRVVKEAVGSIDFNEDMVVQVFTPYPGQDHRAVRQGRRRRQEGPDAVHHRQPRSAAGRIHADRRGRRAGADNAATWRA